MQSTLVALFAAFLLCLSGCSDDDNGSKCGTCPAGTACNESTGQCESSSGCPAAGCGTNASCIDNKFCACNEGFTDCNQDLAQNGDGCECSGSCNGQSCGTGACDPATAGSCGNQASFCDNGTCKPCPAGKLNCDSINDCESDGACGGGACSPTKKDDCGKDMYCQDGKDAKCISCPSGKYNCDGVGDCESSTACGGGCSPTCKDDEYCGPGNTCVSCPTGKSNCDGAGDCETTGPCLGPGGCIKECTDFDEYLCVKDPANNNRCEECLVDGDCTKNPRSKGITCDTTNLAGTGYNFCVCASDSDCSSSTMGLVCKAVAGANPKLTQCTCDTDKDCPATHSICEGSLFKRCKGRCTSDADCVKGGVQGTCDTGTGKCSYPSYP